jgi:CheY-like chemotaxis protein
MARKNFVILIAEDDPDDILLSKEAIQEAKLPTQLNFVSDGQELLDYLNHQGHFSNAEEAPRPGLILLDLNMPRKDGREALAEIKASSDLRRIPVVVLTTSQEEEDILRTYNLGISGYIKKPVKHDDLVKIMQTIGRYWLDMVKLPQS